MQPNRVQLEYSDLPPGSRLQVTRDESGLTITSPPSGLWNQIRTFLLGWGIGAAVFVTALSVMIYLFAPSAMRTSLPRAVVVNVVVGIVLDWEFLVAMAVVFLIAFIMGRVSVRFTAEPRGLTVTVTMALWPRREFVRCRKIPPAEIRELRRARWGANIIVRTRQMKPRSASYMIAGGRRDAEWTARALRQALGLETDSA